MKTFIYQLMQRPQLIEDIKAGTFDYPESFTEGDKHAVLSAVGKEIMKNSWLWPH